MWRLDGIATERGIGSLKVQCAGSDLGDRVGRPVARTAVRRLLELLRSLASRRSERRVRSLQFSGDPSLWIQIFPHELPTDDAVE